MHWRLSIRMYVPTEVGSLNYYPTSISGTSSSMAEGVFTLYIMAPEQSSVGMLLEHRLDATPGVRLQFQDIAAQLDDVVFIGSLHQHVECVAIRDILESMAVIERAGYGGRPQKNPG